MRFIILSLAFLLIAYPGFGQPDKTIKIGLLVNDLNSKAAINGAELAIKKANGIGGSKEPPYKLIIKSLEGPWGTGSKQAVSLIFDDEVCAILGSSDGRNAHLIEQASTKARTVFLSAWSSEPTLSQAFVPWFFTCVPNDLQQADALIEEIYTKRRIKNIIIVSDKGYDSGSAADNFVKECKANGKPAPVRFKYTYPGNGFAILADSIDKTKAEGIVLFGTPVASLELIRLLKQRKTSKMIFGTLSLLASDQDLNSYNDLILISQVNWPGLKESAFYNEYKKTYGINPGTASAYSFDAMNLLIEAIRHAGTERENIQKYLSGIKFDGVTGLIQFDEKGKRIGIPELKQIKKGVNP